MNHQNYLYQHHGVSPSQPQQLLCLRVPSLQTLLHSRQHQTTNQLAEILTESQFLQSSALSLRVEEVDEQDLKGNPTAVYCEEFPVNSVEGNWVNVVREEGTDLSPHLLDTNTTASNVVREQLNEIRCFYGQL